MRKMLLASIYLLFSIASGTALAVEAPRPVIVLFNEVNLQVNIAAIDINTNSGIEAIGVTEVNTSNLAGGNPNKVRSRLEVKLKVKKSNNNNGLGSYLSYVDTRSYPNPYISSSTNYYCEEDGNVISVDPRIEGYPCDFEANFGIANSGQLRYLVTSLALFSWYENVPEGTVDIGQGSVTVWDPVSHQKI